MRKERSQVDLANELHGLVSEQCDVIMRIYKRYGLPMSKIVVLIRDPENDTMYHVVTNEDEDGLAKALRLAGQTPAWESKPYWVERGDNQ